MPTEVSQSCLRLDSTAYTSKLACLRTITLQLVIGLSLPKDLLVRG